MALSPELRQLKDDEISYEPSNSTKQQIRDKALIALIGPSAIGKSTVAKEITRIGGDDFSEVYIATTRPRRADDPAEYQTADEGFTASHAKTLIHTGAVTNYAIHPSGHIYVTRPESFPASYNILPLMPSVFTAAKQIGFKAVHAAYLVTSAEIFEKQLVARANDPTLADRMSEGRSSLEWALEHTEELSFIENVHGDPGAAGAAIISLLKRPQAQDEKERGTTLAKAMLDSLQP